eukprot:754452-Hanusia_phi.AAC.18
MKEKPNDSEHEERPGKSQFLNVPSDRSEKQSMTVKPVANISSTNAPRQLESLNSFSALNDAASQLNQVSDQMELGPVPDLVLSVKSFEQDGNSDQETVKGNESQATDQKSKKTKVDVTNFAGILAPLTWFDQASDSKGKTAFDEGTPNHLPFLCTPDSLLADYVTLGGYLHKVSRGRCQTSGLTPVGS